MIALLRFVPCIALCLILGNAQPLFSQCSTSELLVQYDPLGPLGSFDPVSGDISSPLISTAGSLSQVHPEGSFNTNVLPVGRVTSSPSPLLSEYVFVSITPAGFVDLDELSYTRNSFNSGVRSASVRSSLDGFTTDIDVLSLTAGPIFGDELIFDLSSLSTLIPGNPVEFRIYFYNAVVDRQDFADLVSSVFGGNGVTITGCEGEPVLVPTLGEWGVISLLLLLLIFGVLKIKQRTTVYSY